MRAPSPESGIRHSTGIKAGAVIAGLLLAAALIAWGLWRHNRAAMHESGGAWSFQPASSAGTTPQTEAAGPAVPGVSPAGSGMLPAPASANAPVLAQQPPTAAPAPQRAEHRTALQRPIPSNEEAMATARRRRRHHRWQYLGLDRIWHWIRRERPQPGD